MDEIHVVDADQFGRTAAGVHGCCNRCDAYQVPEALGNDTYTVVIRHEARCPSMRSLYAEWN